MYECMREECVEERICENCGSGRECPCGCGDVYCLWWGEWYKGEHPACSKWSEKVVNE